MVWHLGQLRFPLACAVTVRALTRYLRYVLQCDIAPELTDRPTTVFQDDVAILLVLLPVLQPVSGLLAHHGLWFCTAIITNSGCAAMPSMLAQICVPILSRRYFKEM